MANSWQFLPNGILEQERRHKDAEEWGMQQRGKLAEEWAAQQRARNPFAGFKAGASVGQPGRWDFLSQPDTPGLPLVSGAGKALGMAGAGMQEFGERVAEPLAQNIDRPIIELGQQASERLGGPRSLTEPAAVARAGAVSPLPLLGLQALQGLQQAGGAQQWWQGLQQSYEQRPEDFPGQKGAAEALIGPSQVAMGGIGPGEIKAGVNLARGVAKEAAPVLGRVGRELAGEAGAARAVSFDMPIGQQISGPQLSGPAQRTGLATAQVESTGQRTSALIPSSIPPEGPGAQTSAAIVAPTKVGVEELWNRSRNIIEKQGPAGKKLAGKIYDTRESAERMTGDWTKRLVAVRKLGKDDFDNFVDVVEGKAQPSNAMVQKAAGEWTPVADEIWNRANKAGAVVGKQADYFPHVYDAKMFEGQNKEKAIQHLVATGQAKDVLDAETMLRNLRDVTRNRRLGNLAKARVVDLPGYERTKDALLGYVRRAADDIAQVEQLGKKDRKAIGLLRQMGQQGYDRDAAENLFNIAVGAKQYGTKQEVVSRGARSFNVLTKLGLGAITNASQSLNTATVVGPLRTMLNTPKAAFSKEARDYALEIGVTVDSVIKDLREGAGWEGKLGNVAAPFFNVVERFNRTLAATAGRDYASMLAGKAAKGEQWAVEELGKMRLDGAKIAKRGTLTRDEEITAARNIVERTQFKVDPQDLPGWASSPLGKVVAQFRTFGYNQTAFMAREVIQPAMKGNVKPLLTFLLFGLPLGAAEVEVQNFLRQRPSEEDPVQRIRQYYQRVGGIGVLGDVLAGIAPPNTKYLPGERYALQVAGTAFGPSMGTFLEGAGSIATALQGKPEGIERWGLKQIPVVGPTLKNMILPYKPGGRNAPSGSDLDKYLQKMQVGPSSSDMDKYLQKIAK